MWNNIYVVYKREVAYLNNAHSTLSNDALNEISDSLKCPLPHLVYMISNKTKNEINARKQLEKKTTYVRRGTISHHLTQYHQTSC